MTSLTFLFGIESRVLFAVMIKNQIWILNPREASDTLERSTASISSGPGYSDQYEPIVKFTLLQQQCVGFSSASDSHWLLEHITYLNLQNCMLI